MQVGFIGLGIMGKPMCINLIKAGYEVVACDLNQEAVAAVAFLGAKTAVCGRETAKSCSVIITMLPDAPQVREVILGQDGIMEGAADGTVVIDMSSINPVDSRAIGFELERRGIGMLDAPVSGGEPKAIDGTLSVMAGGSRALFDQYEALLKAMAGSVVYVGELGSGNVAKLANQIIVAANIAAVSEALTFAKKAGAAPELVYQAIRGGLAGSTVMEAKVPMMLRRDFRPGFRIELHRKDLNNALGAACAVNAPVPLTETIMEMLQELTADGYGKEDHSCLIKYYEKAGDTAY